MYCVSCRASPDARLPRSLVCALTAELSVAIAEKPWDFFDHTDLLDFPGARSRLKLANLEDVAKAKGVAEGANPLRELLLRGKVAYLFQRYSAERELSAILLCIPDGNQEVRDLSDMMGAWIDQTIGATPADRAKQKNALFLVLTKMDREFEQKAGETEESRRLRWSARIGNSLVNNFRGEWPTNWNGRPFDNTFWLRNPTVIDERLMDYRAGRETGIAEAFAERAAINTPIQGSAADLVKVAMLSVHRALAKRAGSRLLLQVHDELLVECPRGEADSIASLVKREMEGCYPLEVPLTVSVGVGDTWFDVH